MASTEEEARERAAKSHWVALESNPVSLSKFAHSIGASEEFAFSDAWGLDEEMLSFQPQPVLAVIFLFPTSKCCRDDSAKVVKTEDVWFMKQLVGNACGTVAVVHALANNRDTITLKEDSVLNKFLIETKDKSPLDRGIGFGEAKGIEAVAEQVATDATENQTAAPAADDSIDCHFIAFTRVGENLYELDGRYEGPIDHGKTTAETFLKDAVAVIQKNFIAKNPEENFFSVLTLGPPRED
eukprot:CAMPEP_0174233176 /NCGR_PEP_ID=MMETSP0417-20130205/3279_1 /TAXON_ID=242541 /ORGANISM="Mayorella sp, Strain BSH-02190019" /LENGTH=239 /DNA_ID=CAMNT_0015311345 /DNA_START=123 /DNA_END=842 /DNA_ORIENTATION=-